MSYCYPYSNFLKNTHTQSIARRPKGKIKCSKVVWLTLKKERTKDQESLRQIESKQKESLLKHNCIIVIIILNVNELFHFKSSN